MTQYLITFPSDAMNHIPAKQMPEVSRAAHAVCQELIDAGAYVVTGGLEDEPAKLVGADGTVTDGPRPNFIGAITIVDVPSREDALKWAAKIAAACRCTQEVRAIGFDPELEAMLGEVAADGRRTSMLISRTTGTASVVPELVYADVEAAIEWLCDVFGFTEIWRAGGHRARIAFGNGVVIIADQDLDYGRVLPRPAAVHSHSVMVKVDDVDAHHDHAHRRGAQILTPPTDYPYGERQYSALDLGGHRWTFTQTIADLAPEDWGGQSRTPMAGRA